MTWINNSNVLIGVLLNSIDYVFNVFYVRTDLNMLFMVFLVNCWKFARDWFSIWWLFINVQFWLKQLLWWSFYWVQNLTAFQSFWRSWSLSTRKSRFAQSWLSICLYFLRPKSVYKTHRFSLITRISWSLNSSSNLLNWIEILSIRP